MALVAKMCLKFSELPPLPGTTEPVEAATGHGQDLNHSLSKEFGKGRCRPVGRTVFLERCAELAAQRTPLHYFSKAKVVLPHNGQKGCNSPRSQQQIPTPREDGLK